MVRTCVFAWGSSLDLIRVAVFCRAVPAGCCIVYSACHRYNPTAGEAQMEVRAQREEAVRSRMAARAEKWKEYAQQHDEELLQSREKRAKDRALRLMYACSTTALLCSALARCSRCPRLASCATLQGKRQKPKRTTPQTPTNKARAVSFRKHAAQCCHVEREHVRRGSRRVTPTPWTGAAATVFGCAADGFD